MSGETITAGMLVIGDEILSGRTKEKNAGHLAELMTAAGIDLREIRIVGDDEEDIIAAVNALRKRYTYVFTSGGIGPTHDDITADAIAKAFGLPCDDDPRAMQILGEHYAARNMEFTDARKRMARMPEGAALIDNPVSRAPGFVVDNVHVMAGVPSVFEAMLQNVLPTLRTGAQVLSRAIPCDLGEGDIGGPLGEIQKANPQTSIGSYPRFNERGFSTEIVIRSREAGAIEAAESAVRRMIAEVSAAKAR